MPPEVYFPIALAFLSSTLLIVIAVWVTILSPLLKKQKEKRIADDLKFRKEMETAINQNLSEIINQAILKTVDIIKEELKKKE